MILAENEYLRIAIQKLIEALEAVESDMSSGSLQNKVITQVRAAITNAKEKI